VKRIELLAPAGNMECLKTAFYFGADAAYLAGKSFGLRAFANNFSNDEIKDALRLAHGEGKRIYITLNAVLYNGEIEELKQYHSFLQEVRVDGMIISDPAVLQVMREEGLELPVHLSTQANTSNYMAARFWHGQGIKRIVLSREVSLREIAKIRQETDSTLELEAFVHGAMCIAHSGRCLLSSFFTGRSGNRGECAQPCRWEYSISERGYENEYFDIAEDGRGTYLLNSKDLMMIEHIPELVASGVTSFKIEGRMKSAYYVASTVGAYRRALDAYYEQGEAYRLDEGLKEELEKSATRGFTKGFFFGNPRTSGQDTTRERVYRQYVFVAKVLGSSEGGYVDVEQRNKFSLGDVLEVLSPSSRGMSFEIREIWNADGQEQSSAPHPQQKVRINCPFDLHEGDILRRQDGKEGAV